MDTQGQRLVGSVVDGRYRVEAFVARGGMACVYRATDLRLERVVALKVMHASLAEDPEFVERFEREARAAARLTHPAIVGVFDQGAAGGIVYLAMEYVDGSTLRDVISANTRLDAGKALTILESVLEALTAAHQAGFAHRDIKPENVLIAKDGRVKVADFGLARTIQSTKTSALTQGLLMGTVAYLAPEQVERGASDARSDVYSAGIVLYECVVGQAPYAGETPMAVAYQHVHSTVPAPSSIRPEIPAQIDELVLTATRPDPAARYTDAADFVQHLRTVRTQVCAAVASYSHTVVLDREQATVTVGPWLTAPLAINTPPTVVHSETTIGPPAVISEPRSRKPRRWRVLVAALVLILLGGGAGAGAWAWEKSQIVTAPTLLGLTPPQANAKLLPLELGLTVVGQDFSVSVPSGQILSTDPTGGTELRKGQTITAHTSAGPEMVTIPKVVNGTKEKALARLKAARLQANVTEEFNQDIKTGRVVSAKPAQGKRVRVGTRIELLVSKGPPPVTVPDVVGMDRNAAVSRLRSAGLTVNVEKQLPIIVIGRVYSQDPGPGTSVPQGTTITITIV